MIDGWIILDKPSGISSRAAGGRIARMFGAKTFGHIGTLDPMASGLLPIALGQATKMIPFMEGKSSKEYLFSVKWGFETDTLDTKGHEIKTGGKTPTEKEIKAACKKLIGEYDQVPPNYSAIHINGQRAYKLACSGVNVDMPPRRVFIHELELIDSKSWTFRVSCGTGTYVRSLVRDIAKLCGTLATVDMIRRTKTTGFEIKDAHTLDFLEKLVNNDQALNECLKPMDFGLGDIPVLNLNDKDADYYKKGGFVKMALAIESGLFRVYSGDEFIGIGKFEDGLLRPKRNIT
ncbi:MAG TPA: tRNA pseudouridine(55) synthase TruB [Alphaproteobacteria bacterium]|nr:tRNA pseudouridine(55) synthase TruB [Alphaproteobacteria bacterium]